jgi:RND family efflux transporter MFP subunit
MVGCVMCRSATKYLLEPHWRDCAAPIMKLRSTQRSANSSPCRVRLMFRKRNSAVQRPTKQRRILILSVRKRSMPPKAMTRPDYDAAVDQHTSATASVEAAVRQIEARRGQLSAASAQAVSARINLGDTSLDAPMPGVIVEKSVEPGSLVASGTRAFTLDDTRVVKVNFGVPDSMLAHLKLGAPVPVQLDALQGRTFTGQISGISASANRESRVFNIEVTLPNRDRSLRVGMIARIRIEQANTQTVPLVPLTALMTAESGSNNYSVFTVTERDGKQLAQLKSVRIGETFGKSVVIDEGLTPGEQIVVNRTNQLSDGSLIRVIKQERQQ